MLNKIGSPEKINIVKQAFTFDINSIVKLVQEKTPNKVLTLDQLHEMIKSIGIIDYTSDDMNKLLALLQSVNIKVSNT